MDDTVEIASEENFNGLIDDAVQEALDNYRKDRYEYIEQLIKLAERERADFIIKADSKIEALRSARDSLEQPKKSRSRK